MILWSSSKVSKLLPSASEDDQYPWAQEEILLRRKQSEERGRCSHTVVGRIMVFKGRDVHALIPRICEDIRLHGNREFRLLIS